MAEGDPDEFEMLLQLARRDPVGERIVLALIRRILTLQDEADEDRLLALVAEVTALLEAAD